MNNSADILKYAMEMEKRAKEFYDFYKDKVKNYKIKQLFSGLSDMEDEHYNILKKQLDSVEKNNTFEPLDLELSSGESIITSKEKDMEHVDMDYDLSDLPILRMAYAMENDFAVFYEKAVDQVDDENAKNLLRVLAKWENEHRKAFEDEVAQATQNSWFGQSFYPF